MIDAIAIFVSHSLLLVAFWRLMQRPDLDDDAPEPDAPARGFAAPGGEG